MKHLSTLPALCFSLLVSVAAAQAQAPNFAWAERAGGTNNDYGRAIAADASGNSYVTGSFEGSATFGSTTLTSSGNADVYIAKYDATGNVLWAQKAGGTEVEAGYGIVVDASGNSYITGPFEGSATFGSTTLTSSGSADVFIAKYDAAGNLLWAKNAVGITDDFSRGIALDGNGNLYVTGYFVAGTSSDIFIAKYDTAGNALWVQDVGGSEADSGLGIAVDANGNSFITGFFGGTATFGNTTLISSGNADIFIAKYDTAGNVLWAQQAGGSDSDLGLGIAVDNSGNSYITGHFVASASFGNTALTSSGSTDVFLAKYDAAGNVLWAQKAGGSGGNSGRGITADGSGNTYITGFFAASINIGSTTLGSSGSTDVFVAKYDAAGNALWARKAGGTALDYPLGIAADSSGNTYITGFLDGSATFGSTTIANSGSRDMFLAKLSTVTGTPEETTNSLTGYPNPFTTSFQIVLPAASAQPATAILTDLLGREVHRQVVQPEAAGTITTITPAVQLLPGVYVLKLQQDQTTWLVRLKHQ